MKFSFKRLLEAFVGIFYIVWFVSPIIFMNNNPLYLFFIPTLGLFKISLMFWGQKFENYTKPESVFASLLRFAETSFLLFYTLKPFVFEVFNLEMIIFIPKEILIFSGVFLIINVLSVTILIKSINRLDKNYSVFTEFRKSNKRANILFRIRTKLLFSFIGIITCIVVVLSIQLLDNYKKTLLKAISDGANNQVQQTSATYRINLGDNIVMSEYLERQIEINDEATFSYNNLSIYTNFQTQYYLGDEVKDIENYQCEYSTIDPGVRNPELPEVIAEDAISYISEINSGLKVIQVEKEQFFNFIAPIVKNATLTINNEKVKKERLLGFSIITFNNDIIMKPYFKVRNLVIILTAIFLYLSIILIYLVGNLIVNPILFLRMNVKQVSSTLSNMINGEIPVNGSSLIFNDSITSHDEIKFLSKEINEMVAVIRGIVPYISASTLQHADRDDIVSEEKDLTFLFTDIRGFTTLCEGLSPNEVVQILNKYLNLETEIILKNNGDVDKFVGDEVMAFFEGPDKEVNAVKAAMDIRHAMMEEKDIRTKEGLPIVNIGIGINTGKVTFGSVGSKNRMDFTSIGDTVNLAARLEGANKAYGSKSIISEAVYLKVKDKFLCRELDSITVKGKNEPVRIYEIIQCMEKVQPKLVEIKELFENGLDAYRNREWEKALEFFNKNLQLYSDKPSEVFIERVNHFKINPPDENWDGVFRMTVK